MERSLPGGNVSEMVLSQLEVITGGHARAIGEAVDYITAMTSISDKLSTWENARDIYFPLAAYLLGNGQSEVGLMPKP